MQISLIDTETPTGQSPKNQMESSLQMVKSDRITEIYLVYSKHESTFFVTGQSYSILRVREKGYALFECNIFIS
jgi:hypothetical protein